MQTKLFNLDLTEAYGFDMVPRGNKIKDPIKISGSQTAFDTLKQLYTKESIFREEFYVLYLDRANNVKAINQLSVGGLHGTVVDIRIILKYAIDCLACGMILSHNHPSGNLKPSTNDDAITKRIAEAGKILDILVLDHLIVSESSYYSYADEGKL